MMSGSLNWMPVKRGMLYQYLTLDVQVKECRTEDRLPVY